MPPLLRRRPLLRAAAIGGGAYYEGKRRIEVAEELKQLGALHAAGVVTDEQFRRREARLLD